MAQLERTASAAVVLGIDSLRRCGTPPTLPGGQGGAGRNRFYRWRVAYGSGWQLAVHLPLLADTGALDAPAGDLMLALLDEERALAWRMRHRRLHGH